MRLFYPLAGWFLSPLLVVMVGCTPTPTTAVVNGVVMPRLTQEYAGQPPEATHERHNARGYLEVHAERPAANQGGANSFDLGQWG